MRLTKSDVDALRRSPPLVLTLPEAVAYSRLGDPNFRSKLKARVFPHVRIGGRILIRRPALDAALARLEVTAIGGAE